MKLFKSRLKSLKTRLNVFLNVFLAHLGKREGEMSEQVVDRRRGGFYRSSTAACICVYFCQHQLLGVENLLARQFSQEFFLLLSKTMFMMDEW
jgi:hypothetical protein